MSQTLTPNVVRKSFDIIADRIKEDNLTPTVVREIIYNCDTGSILLERILGLIQQLLERGTEREPLVLFLKESQETVERSFRLFNNVAPIVVHEGLTPKERAEGPARIDRWTGIATMTLDKVSSLLHWLESSKPKVSPSSLPEQRGDPAASGYVNLNDILAAS